MSRLRKSEGRADDFPDKPGVSVLDNGKGTSFRYGFIVKELRKRGNSIPANVIWIAASAMESGSILLSRDKHLRTFPDCL